MKNVNWLRKAGVALVGVGFLLVGSSAASANTINLTNTLGGIVASGSGSEWTYRYTFGNSQLAANDAYMTINDFGVAALVVAPDFPSGNWVMQPQTLLGFNEVNPLLPDDPTILNVTFRWVGPLSQVILNSDTFTLYSPVAPFIGNLVSYTTGDNNAEDAGLPSNGLGVIRAPGAATVPDGGLTAMLLGSVMFAVGAFRRKFNGR